MRKGFEMSANSVSDLKVLSAIATLDRESILRVLEASGVSAPADLEWLPGLREHLADAYIDGDAEMASIVTAYFGRPDVPAWVETLGEFVGLFPNFASLQLCPELRDLEIDCVVAKDCCKVLLKGNEMIELCADFKLDVVELVRRQMEVFYFG